MFEIHSRWQPWLPCIIMESHQVSLNCYYCNLSTVSADLPKEIRSLDLSFNPLKQLFNRGFSRLSKLEILDLTRCDITSIEDNAFVGLGSLQILILTGNPIKNWSLVTFTGLNSLQKLVLVDTSLESLSELNLEYLPSLQELNVAKNRIHRLYIPSFLFNLHILDLRANYISRVNKEDLEKLQHVNTSNLSLILTLNLINFIEPGAFRYVKLQLLNLKGCFSNEDIMKDSLNAMSGLYVENLVIGRYRSTPTRINCRENLFEGLCGMNIKGMTITDINQLDKKTSYHCLENITSQRFLHLDLELMRSISFSANVQKIEIKNTYITAIPYNFFSKLKQLKELRIKENRRLTELNKSVAGLKELEFLDMSVNKLMIESCCNELFPETTLKHLNFSHNTLIGLKGSFIDLPHLLSLDLSHSKLDSVGMYPIFMTLTNLLYLNLSYTSCHFVIHCSFCGLFNLVELRVSQTTFVPEILASVFQNLTSLRFLDMASCNLEHIPNEMFEHVKQLQFLDLSNNKLIELSSSVLLSLSGLKFLDIRANNINGFSVDTAEMLSKNPMKVELSQNPFDCSCTQEQFLLWVNQQSNKGLNFSNQMECKTPEHLQGSLLRDVNLNCNWTLAYVMVVVIVVILFLTLLLYHFYLKNCFLFLCLCRQDYKRSAAEKIYDAFVIHSSLDEHWVKDVLLPQLESGEDDNPSFQLCVHFRDFEAGKLILENIFYNGICCSRNALVILSPHFIDSKWCSFEFKLAMFWRFLEDQCGIILILLEPIRKDQLDHMYVLKKHLSRNTYLKWEDEHKKKKLFWKRLRQALGQAQNVADPLLSHTNMEICHRQNKQNKECTQI
uniref:Toll-like receptor 4 n=1 Tax=Pyxicephalus adspersus TaxID=30357 RepID=A0AAV3ABW7_PYXAD|nr:TPA: hypothetical protein GDO54_018281 [Pyxicephalus adspersus]